MAESIIVEGRTTNDAIEKGLKTLNVSKDMVDIKVIEETEKRSFYSILSPRVVKVELTVKEGITEKVNTNKKEYNSNPNEINVAKEEVANFLKRFLEEGLEYSVEINENELFVKIDGDSVNYLIGYRGETINALQVVLSAIANRTSTAKVKLFLDVANYREKRIKTLEDLAEKVAKTVVKTNKSITLEPMTAYERKIIHSKLQSNPNVKTFSKGEEPNRRLVISLK